jgi:SAM-dependent methyltransferase
VGEILEVDDPAAPAAPAAARRYRLPAGHAEVLLDRDSLVYLAPMSRMVGALSRALPALLDAYRAGGGVPWAVFGDDGRQAQADMNRPLYLKVLGGEWLPAIPDLHARLQADPPARVAEIGCGAGWASIAIARAYPKVLVDGYDVDEPSIALARANAAEAGVADRVRFHLVDAAELQRAGRYDLVTAFEMVHDLARPVEVLRAARGMLAEGGAMLIMDERVAERFTAPGDEVERFLYGGSVLCCLPAGLAETPSAGTGTVMRPDTLRRYATEAGFRDLEILPIEHDFYRLYRLVP